MMPKLESSLPGVLLLFIAIPAFATPVTFFFTGRVVSDAINGCGGLVNCGVVTGTYTFDTATPDLNPDPTEGLYAVTNVTFSIDGVPFFSSAAGFINVANFPGVDQYGLLAMGIAANGSPATLSILLTDPTGTAFSSDALPSNPTVLTPLLPGTFQLNAADDTFQLAGSIDSVSTLTAGMGFVQVCKIGVAGVAAGTNFAFNVGGTAVTVAAGLGPNGTCGAPVSKPAGLVTVTETLPAGVVVTSASTLPPGALFSSNLGAGTASVSVIASGLTVVTFTDALLVDTGTVQVCKIGGSGLLLGTPFTFNIAGTQIVVPSGTAPAGTCGPALIEPAGTILITETLAGGVALTGVTTAPVAALTGSNLAAGTANVTVTAGAQTTVTFTDVLPGVVIPGDAFQVRYASHLDVGDSFINITNTGASSTTAFPVQNGNLCVNAYTFSPDEQLISCCSCLVSPNAIVSLSARNDLISNTLTPAVPTSIVVKLLATTATTCNAATAANALAPGLQAWASTLHALPVTPGSPFQTYGMTETPFTVGTLSSAEFTRITSLCGFIQNNGSGFGICKSCRLGGLGAAGK